MKSRILKILNWSDGNEEQILAYIEGLGIGQKLNTKYRENVKAVIGDCTTLVQEHIDLLEEFEPRHYELEVNIARNLMVQLEELI